MATQKLKGLWISAEILLDEKLTDKEKFILSMILYLSDETSGCFASNQYIASIVKVSTNRVSKIMSSLKNKKYIQVKLKYKKESKEIEQRQIIPIVHINNRYGQESQEDIGENNNTDSQNGQCPIGENNNLVDKATKYEKERKRIMCDNEKLHNEVDKIKSEYKQKEFDMEWEYKSRIRGLEKENKHLHKVVDRFKETIDKFIKWICKKFDMGAENNLIRDFERENNIMLDAEKQIKREEREKDLEMEI